MLFRTKQAFYVNWLSKLALWTEYLPELFSIIQSIGWYFEVFNKDQHIDISTFWNWFISQMWSLLAVQKSLFGDLVTHWDNDKDNKNNKTLQKLPSIKGQQMVTFGIYDKSDDQQKTHYCITKEANL